MTNWKTWPKCVFFSFFLSFFFWAADVSNLDRSQLFSVWNKELDLWMNKIQDKTQLKKSVVQSVLLCLSCLLMYILTSKFITNWKKIKQAKQKLKAWILLNQTRTEKQTRAAALRHTFFFSLVLWNLPQFGRSKHDAIQSNHVYLQNKCWLLCFCTLLNEWGKPLFFEVFWRKKNKSTDFISP